MRYKVNSVEVRSENAAKPSSQYSAYLMNWILNQNGFQVSIDYGCGKLRYSNYLRKVSKYTLLVDSNIQLNRVQIINGFKTTVKDYVSNNWKDCKLVNVNNFTEKNVADFVLCANVLSAIPSVVTRSETVSKIAASLKQNGKCLFVTQHTNSYFTKLANSAKSIKHLDGWLVLSKRGASYYGIIDRTKIKPILENDFSSLDIWREGQSTYALVRK